MLHAFTFDDSLSLISSIPLVSSTGQEKSMTVSCMQRSDPDILFCGVNQGIFVVDFNHHTAKFTILKQIIGIHSCISILLS